MPRDEGRDSIGYKVVSDGGRGPLHFHKKLAALVSLPVLSVACVCVFARAHTVLFQCFKNVFRNKMLVSPF